MAVKQPRVARANSKTTQNQEANFLQVYDVVIVPLFVLLLIGTKGINIPIIFFGLVVVLLGRLGVQHVVSQPSVIKHKRRRKHEQKSTSRKKRTESRNIEGQQGSRRQSVQKRELVVKNVQFTEPVPEGLEVTRHEEGDTTSLRSKSRGSFALKGIKSMMHVPSLRRSKSGVKDATESVKESRKSSLRSQRGSIGQASTTALFSNHSRQPSTSSKGTSTHSRQPSTSSKGTSTHSRQPSASSKATSTHSRHPSASSKATSTHSRNPSASSKATSKHSRQASRESTFSSETNEPTLSAVRVNSFSTNESEDTDQESEFVSSSSEDEDDGLVVAESQFGTFFTDSIRPLFPSSISELFIDYDTVDPDTLYDVETIQKYAEHWRQKAIVAQERAQQESERVQMARQRTVSLHETFESQIAELRDEARRRQEAIVTQRQATEAQLKAAFRKRRMSLRKTSSQQQSIRRIAEAEVAEAAAEIEALKAKLAAVESALDVDVKDLEWDGTLGMAEQGLRDCASRMMADGASDRQVADAQYEFDKWDKIVRNHVDFKQREASKWEQWESGNIAANEEALDTTRKFVPVEIVDGIHIEELLARGLSRGLANRIHKNSILRFVHMSKSAIAKIHPQDLISRYNTQGLDIVELRAVYYCLPTSFEHDRDGQKAAYRENMRAKLFQMTQEEAGGTLAKSKVRHPLYADASALQPRPPGFVPAPRRPPGVRSSRQSITAQAAVVTQETLDGITGFLHNISSWWTEDEEPRAQEPASPKQISKPAPTTSKRAPRIKHKVSEQYLQHNHASKEYHLSGARSAQRAARLGNQMDTAIQELLGIIKRVGKPDPDAGGKISVTFGELFVTYENVNDMLVGILSRAKKRGLVNYDGEMLFQRRHDHVKIILL